MRLNMLVKAKMIQQSTMSNFKSKWFLTNNSRTYQASHASETLLSALLPRFIIHMQTAQRSISLKTSINIWKPLMKYLIFPWGDRTQAASNSIFSPFFVGNTNRIIITGLFFVYKQNEDENEHYVLRPRSPRTVPKNSCGVPVFTSPPDTAAAERGQVVLIFFRLSQLISNVIRSTATSASWLVFFFLDDKP